MKPMLAGMIVFMFLAWVPSLAGAVLLSPPDRAFQGDLSRERVTQVDPAEACGVRSSNPVRPCRQCPSERAGEFCTPAPCGSTLIGGEARVVYLTLHGMALRPACAGGVAGVAPAPEPPPPRS